MGESLTIGIFGGFFRVQYVDTFCFGIIWNDLPFWEFYRCVNIVESLTNLSPVGFV